MSLDDLLTEWAAEHPKAQSVERPALSEVPRLETSGLDALFVTGTELSEQRIRGLLASPKFPLLRDLKKLLQHAISDYPAYVAADDKTQLTRAQLSFVLHALLLRRELGGADLLSDLHAFLERPAHEIRFWLEDRADEVLWLLYASALPSGLSQVEADILNKTMCRAVRSAAVTALGHLAMGHPYLLPKLGPVFARCIQGCAASDTWGDDALLAGLLIAEVERGRIKELLPVVREAFATGSVDTAPCGTLDKIELAFQSTVNSWAKMEALDIYALYALWEQAEQVEHIEAKADSVFLDLGRPKLAKAGREGGKSLRPQSGKAGAGAQQNKVGRNDLCPCGSGQKYKKCHGK